MSSNGDKQKESKRKQWEAHNRAKAEKRSKELPDEKPHQVRAVRGTRDILPPETAKWNEVEQKARDVFSRYGFEEIRVPILEPTELFVRSIGTETDVVSKEMYTMTDQPSSIPDLSDLGVTPAYYVEEIEFLFKSGEIQANPINDKALAKLKFELDLYKGRLEDNSVERADTLFRLRASRIRFGESISLRPEATASVCRAYLERNLSTSPGPTKLFYTGPMFRRERPQKGRYRQFYQIGAEVLGGTDAAVIEAELLEMLMSFFGQVGLSETQLSINSIGDRECRPRYIELLRAELEKVKQGLGPDSQRRIATNPLRVLDSKSKNEQEIISRLPRISDHLCAACEEHYSELKRQLDLRGIRYREDWRLVRGLDYYSRTTFEITATGLGSQDAVCGGGRYDGLIEQLGGPPTSGIGFAIGTDRLLIALDQFHKSSIGTSPVTIEFDVALQRPDVAIIGSTPPTWDRAIQLATSLRSKGLSVFLPKVGTKISKGFDAAHRLGIRVAVVVGEEELSQNRYTIRILNPLDPDRPRDFPVESSKLLVFGKIVKLRQDLERELLRLAAGKPEFERHQAIREMVRRLVEGNLLPPALADRLSEVSPILNRAIHGETLTDGTLEWVLAYGNLLLNELERLSPLEA